MSSSNGNSLNLQVTGPDGRTRVKVAIPASQTVKQLTTAACEKLGITTVQADRYTLRHGRTLLSPACNLNLLGLVTGAKLDLVPNLTSTGRPSSVKVALQYVGDRCKPMTTRMTLEIPSETILWDLLRRFQEQSGGELALLIPDGPSGCLVPHLVILGQEFTDSFQFTSVSLASLGICQGTCLVRMSHRRLARSLQEVEQELPSGMVGGREGSTLGPGEIAPSLETKMKIDDRLEPKTALFKNSQVSPLSEPWVAELAPSDCPVRTELQRRNVILYAPPSTSNLRASPDLPEGHYEMGSSEFRIHWAAQQARTRALLETPLLSQAKLRERQQREFLERHPKTILRFRFPDQYMMEATFESTEAISDLFVFIDATWAGERDAIPRPTSTSSFHPFSLSIGPPPKVLARSDQSPLWRHDLVPAAIINVTWNHGSGHGGRTTPDLLLPEIVTTLVSRLSPSSPSENLKSPPEGPTPETTGTIQTDSPSPSSSLPTPREVATTGTLKKPAWLRL